MEPDDELLNELAELAADLAFQAGDLLLEGWRGIDHVVTTKSTPTDMVSDMDKASEDLLVEGILRVRPDDGILGEEGTQRPSSSGVRWILDPLDGTVNYLYGLPDWCVSVAAEVDGEVAVGIVVAPAREETFAAIIGRGAFRNDEPIQCSAVTDPTLALVATGFSYDIAVRRRQGEIVGALVWRIRDIRRFGAAALDLCHVADGTVDGYFERGPKDWDVAAGGLIAREAGARTRWDGDFVAAANPLLLTALEVLGIE